MLIEQDKRSCISCKGQKREASCALGITNILESAGPVCFIFLVGLQWNFKETL
eukprot:m.345103 g.345103  ORF g.345103 m.345103 type:complete len:53 (+) comp25741_c0_seq1:421-579(+)